MPRDFEYTPNWVYVTDTWLFSMLTWDGWKIRFDGLDLWRVGRRVFFSKTPPEGWDLRLAVEDKFECGAAWPSEWERGE